MVLAVVDLECGDDWFYCATGNYFGVSITMTETTLCSHCTRALSSPGEGHEPRTGAWPPTCVCHDNTVRPRERRLAEEEVSSTKPTPVGSQRAEQPACDTVEIAAPQSAVGDVVGGEVGAVSKGEVQPQGEGANRWRRQRALPTACLWGVQVDKFWCDGNGGRHHYDLRLAFPGCGELAPRHEEAVGLQEP